MRGPICKCRSGFSFAPIATSAGLRAELLAPTLGLNCSHTMIIRVANVDNSSFIEADSVGAVHHRFGTRAAVSSEATLAITGNRSNAIVL